MDICSCNCDGGLTLIFACGGAADVGEVADRVARKLNRDGVGKMFCIVGIGGRVSGIMESTKAADLILAIDGCPLQCVRHSLEQAGFTNFKHLKLWELGLQKGKTGVTDEIIAKVAEEAKKLLKQGT